jgi:hypothetical protein
MRSFEMANILRSWAKEKIQRALDEKLDAAIALSSAQAASQTWENARKAGELDGKFGNPYQNRMSSLEENLANAQALVIRNQEIEDFVVNFFFSKLPERLS